jgi:hypothetical protein
MKIEIRNNGWINGKVFSARWLEMGPDAIAMAAGSMAIHVPTKLSGGIEVYVDAPRGIIVRGDNCELSIDGNLILTMDPSGRITVRAPGKETTFSITTWDIEVEEPDTEPEVTTCSKS